MLSRCSVFIASALALSLALPAQAAPARPPAQAAAAAPAGAAPTGTPAPTAGTPAPGGSPAPAAKPAAAEPTAAQKTQARDELRRGNELYNGGKYEDALTAFRASYAAVPSPNSHLMIGRSLLRIGRGDLAYEELRATAEEATERGTKYKDAKEAAEKELETLKAQLAFVTVTVAEAPPGSVVTVGDREVPVEQLPEQMAILAGEITIAASGDGRTASEKVTVAAGEQRKIELSLAPPPPAPPPAAAPPPATLEVDTDDGSSLRTWAYVAGGIGAAGLITFGVFGYLNQSKFSDLEDACPGGTCPPDRESDIDTGRTYQTVANIGLIVGAVGIATGVTLFVVSSGSDEQAAKAPTVRVAAGPGSVLVKGAF